MRSKPEGIDQVAGIGPSSKSKRSLLNLDNADLLKVEAPKQRNIRIPHGRSETLRFIHLAVILVLER